MYSGNSLFTFEIFRDQNLILPQSPPCWQLIVAKDLPKRYFNFVFALFEKGLSLTDLARHLVSLGKEKAVGL